jgi:hypothetical protein
MQLGFTATQDVLAAIASLERTEDIRFSPDHRRLALTAIPREQLFVPAALDIELEKQPRSTQSGTIDCGHLAALSAEMTTRPSHCRALLAHNSWGPTAPLHRLLSCRDWAGA